MFEAECLGGDQVDDEIELGWLLDRQVGRLRPTQNLVDVLGAAPKQRREVCSIGYKTARFDMLAETMHRRQLRTHRQNAESVPIGGYEWITHDIESLYTILECVDCGRDIVGLPDFKRGSCETNRAGRRLYLAHFQHGSRSTDIRHDPQPAKTR